MVKFLRRKFHIEVAQGKVYSNYLRVGLLINTALHLLLLKSAYSEKDTAEDNEHTLQDEVYGAENNCFQYI